MLIEKGRLKTAAKKHENWMRTDRYSRNDGPSSGVLTPESSAAKPIAMAATPPTPPAAAAAELGGVTLELQAELYELNEEPYDPARLRLDWISSARSCLL